FANASGLQANMSKSSVYFGGFPQPIRDRIVSKLGFVYGELPFKYLGIPLSTKKLSLIRWKPLIYRIVTRVTSWTVKKLSYA
ncbi:hypothetical protein A4A49_62870, partial [Nicotiana attenuata]